MSFKEVDLREAELRAGERLVFVKAHVPTRQPSPLAVVDYAVDGELQAYGLRLDLDKRAFIDQPISDVADGALDASAAQLSDRIGPIALELFLKEMQR